MPTAIAQINIDINLGVMNDLGLKPLEYLVAAYIDLLKREPESSLPGWTNFAKEDRTKAEKKLKISRTSMFKILKKLHSKGLIERYQNTTLIRTTTKWYQSHGGTASTKYELPVQDKEKVAPKEININTLSPSEKGQSGKKPSCPLLNGSPLKAKYPNGHNECVEYVQDEEQKRGFRFINQAKQYMAIHKILRAGYGFDKMDKTILQVSKKYGLHSWDYMTLANWLEKGAGNA